jgi:hypothetical protein
MRKPSDDEIIQVIREEWARKVLELTEKIDLMMTTKVDGKSKDVISPGLKVRGKDKEKSKLLYTVEEIGPITVALSYVDLNGKEKLIYIKREDLEKKYELD